MEKLNWHSKISFIKSGLRVIGYTGLVFDVLTGALILIIAELLGIVEEF